MDGRSIAAGELAQPALGGWGSCIPPIRIVWGRPLRVLLLVESSGAGTGRHVLDLAEGLSRRGCDVHLIYSPTRADQNFLTRLAELPLAGRSAIPMRTNAHPADWSVVRAVRGYGRKFGPFDVVHGHSSKGGAIARLAGVGTGARVYYTLHGFIMMDPGLSAWKRFTFLAAELALSLRTHRIIAVAPREARAAVRNGLGSGRVLVIPNGVAPAPSVDRVAVRASIGLPADAVATGFVGRLVEQKDPGVLINAFARVASASPSAWLVIVGDGPLRRELAELTIKLGVERRVIFLGERDAANLYSAFDVFALPSRKEGLPYVVLEAMAAGLPIVATTTAGVETLVEQGINGLVSACGSVQQFSRSLSIIVTDTACRRRMGAASRERAKRFTIDTMVDATLLAYQDARVLAGSQAPLRAPSVDGSI